MHGMMDDGCDEESDLQIADLEKDPAFFVVHYCFLESLSSYSMYILYGS
jgi:hypothetical protein